MGEAGYWLGRAVGTIANVVNPGLVTLGGGLLAADAELGQILGSAAPYLSAVQLEAPVSSLRQSAAVLHIETAVHGNDAGVLGAAHAALGHR
jgi:predicted NBD/HSP70 family sugar kinase